MLGSLTEFNLIFMNSSSVLVIFIEVLTKATLRLFVSKVDYWLLNATNFNRFGLLNKKIMRNILFFMPCWNLKMDLLETVDKMIEQMDEAQYTHLKEAVEIGRWNNGELLTLRQRQHAMQALIMYEVRHCDNQDHLSVNKQGEINLYSKAELKNLSQTKINMNSQAKIKVKPQ
jgi:uncharacterized protein YeaC (DUF1315 family)